jgi:heme exporter protein D
MMPDLGAYAAAVLGSYAATLALLAAIVGLSLWRAARIKRTLRDVERRRERDLG